jgi:hypothetical protein
MLYEADSNSETNTQVDDDQGNYSKRKVISYWDQYQDAEKEVNNEGQKGTDFSVLQSLAVDALQFQFAEGKEQHGEASCPKQCSAFHVDSE